MYHYKKHRLTSIIDNMSVRYILTLLSAVTTMSPSAGIMSTSALMLYATEPDTSFSSKLWYFRQLFLWDEIKCSIMHWKNVFFSHSPHKPSVLNRFESPLNIKLQIARWLWCSTVWPSWDWYFDFVWIGNTGKSVHLKLISFSYRSTSQNTFFCKKQLTFWSAVHAFKFSPLPCMLAK